MRVKGQSKIVCILLLIIIVVFCVGLGLSYIDNEKKTTITNKIQDIRYDKPLYEVGIEYRFNVYDFSIEEQRRVSAECKRIGQYSYIFVEERLAIRDETVRAVQKYFDTSIYPRQKNILTGDVAPGVNADSRVSILILDKSKAFPEGQPEEILRGFYWQGNEHSSFFIQSSNESKIIHIFASPEVYTDEDLLETVAHEAEHLKNWGIVKKNLGLTFGAILLVAMLFLMYLGLSHLYYVFLSAKRV